MKILVLHMLVLLVCLNQVSASEDWKDLELVDTKVSVESSSYTPSCSMLSHRKKVREKKVRESLYASGKQDIENIILSNYIYLSAFEDITLHQEELVYIQHLWRLTDEAIDLFKKNPDEFELKIQGSGVNWFERISFFPSKVFIHVDLNNKVLHTGHTAFYVDRCNEQEVSNLDHKRITTRVFWKKTYRFVFPDEQFLSTNMDYLN